MTNNKIESENKWFRKFIVIAGGTGNLGGRIIKALIEKGVEVQALVLSTSDKEKIVFLERIGQKSVF